MNRQSAPPLKLLLLHVGYISLRKANTAGMLLNLLDVLLVSGGDEDEGGEHDANGGGGGLHGGDRFGTLKGASDSNLALNT